MPYCQQCGAGVNGFAPRCSSCKQDPFPTVVQIARCPVCERTDYDLDLSRCPACGAELEVIDEDQ